MKRILVVKMSSLGDVIQAQPLASDLQGAFPGVRIDWVADSSCAEVPRWNSAVDRVIDIPLRRFKAKRQRSDWQAIVSSVSTLRERTYDAVIDVQGMYKSAIVSRLARAPRRFGFCRQDLGERGAAFAYTDVLRLPAPTTARQRLRTSVAHALGYPLAEEPSYGLTPPAAPRWQTAPPYSPGPVALLFHATANAAKLWSADCWISVGNELSRNGFHITLPWGSPVERERAVAIASRIPDAEVLPRLDVAECARRVVGASLVVGLDTGFVHLADALGTPTVMLFSSTSRTHYGVETQGRSTSVGDAGKPPSVRDVLGAITRVKPMLLGRLASPLAQVPRSAAKTQAKSPAEVRGVVESPGIRDIADAAGGHCGVA